MKNKKKWKTKNEKKQKQTKMKNKKKIKDISLVKIGSVTAEIFQIWANVARTNVAWINVTVTVGMC